MVFAIAAGTALFATGYLAFTLWDSITVNDLETAIQERYTPPHRWVRLQEDATGTTDVIIFKCEDCGRRQPRHATADGKETVPPQANILPRCTNQTGT